MDILENTNLLPREAAKILKVSEALIYRLIKEKEIPCVRIASRAFLTRKTVEILLSEGTEAFLIREQALVIGKKEQA